MEDTLVCAKMLAKVMNKFGLETNISENGDQAVKIIKEHPTDYAIIFMDNKMPVMNGLDASRTIRSIGYDGPIIGVTGNVLDDDIECFLKNGVNEVLSKPVKEKVLGQTLLKYRLI